MDDQINECNDEPDIAEKSNSTIEISDISESELSFISMDNSLASWDNDSSKLNVESLDIKELYKYVN